MTTFADNSRWSPRTLINIAKRTLWSLPYILFFGAVVGGMKQNCKASVPQGSPLWKMTVGLMETKCKPQIVVQFWLRGTFEACLRCFPHQTISKSCDAGREELLFVKLAKVITNSFLLRSNKASSGVKNQSITGRVKGLSMGSRSLLIRHVWKRLRFCCRNVLFPNHRAAHWHSFVHFSKDRFSAAANLYFLVFVLRSRENIGVL